MRNLRRAIRVLPRSNDPVVASAMLRGWGEFGARYCVARQERGVVTGLYGHTDDVDEAMEFAQMLGKTAMAVDGRGEWRPIP